MFKRGNPLGSSRAGCRAAACVAAMFLFLMVQRAATADELSDAKAAAASAKGSLQDAQQKLRLLEDDLERQAPEDAPLSVAKAKVSLASRAYADVVESIRQSPEYKAAIDRLGSFEDRQSEDTIKVREAMVTKDPRIRELSEKLAVANKEYRALRTEFLKTSPDWQRASAEIDELRSRSKDADAEMYMARARQRREQGQLKEAQRAAEQAEFARQQAQFARQQAEYAWRQANQQAQQPRQGKNNKNNKKKNGRPRNPANRRN